MELGSDAVSALRSGSGLGTVLESSLKYDHTRKTTTVAAAQRKKRLIPIFGSASTAAMRERIPTSNSGDICTLSSTWLGQKSKTSPDAERSSTPQGSETGSQRSSSRTGVPAGPARSENVLLISTFGSSDRILGALTFRRCVFVSLSAFAASIVFRKDSIACFIENRVNPGPLKLNYVPIWCALSVGKPPITSGTWIVPT